MLFPTSKDEMAINWSLENCKPISSTHLRFSIQSQHIFTQTTKNTKNIAIYTQSQNTLVPYHTFCLFSGHVRTYLGTYLCPCLHSSRCQAYKTLLSPEMWNDARPTRRCYKTCAAGTMCFSTGPRCAKVKACHECGHANSWVSKVESVKIYSKKQ